MTEDRRLAAIVFADIAGYTSMMQADEQKSLSILQAYTKTLNEQVKLHHGEIVKKYGDGTLLLFASSINAINCCIAIQQELQSKVPLRIGIHMGEVTKKEDDYFGNDINIAARIESMSEVGAILISEDVKIKIDNQAHLSSVLLGSYHFKNVQAPMQVYAISNDGLVVPDKRSIRGKFEQKKALWQRNPILLGSIMVLIIAGSYFGRQFLTTSELESDRVLGKRVAVMPFVNQTNLASLSSIGVMTTDWMNQILLRNKAGKVVSVNSSEEKKLLQGEGQAEFINEHEVEVLIEGNYYKNKDDIYVTSSVTTTDNMEKVFTVGPLKGNEENMMDLLDELQQQTMGYWFLRDDEWVESDPPRYDAYQTFAKHKDVWLKDSIASEKVLLEAYTKDSSFYRPLISLAVHYFNTYDNARGDSILQYIKKQNFPLSNFERLRVEMIQAQLDADWIKAAEISERLFLEYHQTETDAVRYNLNNNNPQRIINLYNDYPEIFVLGDCYTCQQTFGDLLGAYIRLGKYKKAINLVKPLQAKVISADVAVNHLRALVRLYQMEEVDEALENYKQMQLEFYGEETNASLLYWAICQELYLTRKETTLKKYAKLLLEYSKNHPDSETYDQDVYTSYWMLNQLDSAVVHAENWNKKYGDYYHQDLTALQVMAGNQSIGEEAIKNKKPEGLDDLKLWEYNQAKIYTALGLYDEAIDLLEESLDHGQYFFWYYYENDMFFRELLDKPRFQELVKPMELE